MFLSQTHNTQLLAKVTLCMDKRPNEALPYLSSISPRNWGSGMYGARNSRVGVVDVVPMHFIGLVLRLEPKLPNNER